MVDVIVSRRNFAISFSLFMLVIFIAITSGINPRGSSATDASVQELSDPETPTTHFPWGSTAATLTLIPSEGTCDTLIQPIRLEGTNFIPGTETTVSIGILGGDVGSALPGKPVAADGTVTIDMDLLASFGGCAGPYRENDGIRYFIELSTGTPADAHRVPAALAVFTFHLTAAERFDQTWARLDQPVLNGQASRTWIWGPQANTEVLTEEYVESPDRERNVQYFDKSRMEISQPEGDRSSSWYVTNGLLVVEMISGQLQVGDDTFEFRDPASVNVAGDVDGVEAPTYETLNTVLDLAPRAEGTVITERLNHDGDVSSDSALAEYGITAFILDDVTDHTIAAPFWAFMNATGLIWQQGDYQEQPFFENPFYATGRPLTEAYWVTVNVRGISQDVLLQCFERRCLTYTPGNDPGWQVEAGNVGQHYYSWRYD